MNEPIASLLKLQDMDLALEADRQAKAALVPRRAKIQEDQRFLLASFEESKKSLAQAQLDKKSLEGEVEAKEQAIRKHTGELNSVKSNDAYKALLSEIDAAKNEKAGFEDRVLETMELQDRLQKELKEREKTLDGEKADLAQKAAVVDEEEKKIDGDLSAKTAERDAFFGALPEEARRRYETVRRGRPGFAALAEVKDMACQGCRTRLTADVVNTVMKAKEVLLCESCSRILFIRPKPVEAPSAAS